MARTSIDLAPKIERAILVGAPRKRSMADRLHVDEHLQELADLADTAGVQVVGQLVQQIDRPNAATYLGKGKEFTYEAYIEAIRKGRCFATNGPLIFFEVNGKGVGSEEESEDEAEREKRMTKMNEEEGAEKKEKRRKIGSNGIILRPIHP